MPSKFRLRKLFKNRFIVKNIALIFSKIGITPNIVTIIMLIFSISSALILYYSSNLIFFALLLFVTIIMDGVDGTLARLTNKSSQFGGFWDSTLDRLSEAIIYTALYIGWENIIENSLFLFAKECVLFVFLFSFIISYQRSRCANEIEGDFDIGLFARSERLFFLVIISLIGYFFQFIFVIGIVGLLIGVVSTALYRFFKYRAYFYRETN